MLGRHQEVPRLQSDFYRDAYRKTLRWIIVSIGIIFLLLLGIIYLIFFQPPQNYYANTLEGKIISLKE